MAHVRPITLGGMVTIETTRYSAVVTAFVAYYPNAVATLDRQPQTGPVTQWCTNASLSRAIDFCLRDGDIELLGFHDGPRNMWASSEVLGLVEELAAKRVLRFKISAPRARSLFARLFGRRSAA